MLVIGPPLLSRLKYLYWMDCHKNVYRQSWSPEDETHWLMWFPDLSSSTSTRLTFLSFNEMSWQLFEGLPWNLVQIFRVPMVWILMTLVVPWRVLECHNEVHICGWNVSTTIGWIDMKFGTSIYVPLRMNCKNVGDPFTFHPSTATKSKFVQYFGLWQNTCKTDDILISLSWVFC